MNEKLSLMEEKYILRAQAAAMGVVTPDGKQQKQVCERLVSKGRFVPIVGGHYALPEFAEELGLEIEQRPMISGG